MRASSGAPDHALGLRRVRRSDHHASRPRRACRPGVPPVTARARVRAACADGGRTLITFMPRARAPDAIAPPTLPMPIRPSVVPASEPMPGVARQSVSGDQRRACWSSRERCRLRTNASITATRARPSHRRGARARWSRSRRTPPVRGTARRRTGRRGVHPLGCFACSRLCGRTTKPSTTSASGSSASASSRVAGDHTSNPARRAPAARRAREAGSRSRADGAPIRAHGRGSWSAILPQPALRVGVRRKPDGLPRGSPEELRPRARPD